MRSRLTSFDIPTPIKLSLLWASLMSLYIYNDYFLMYTPGTIESMSNGMIGPLGAATPPILVGTSIVCAIPALMIALSSLLSPPISRWLNVGLGLVYSVLQGLTFPGSEPFYQIVVGFEISVTLMIVWIAIRWPRMTIAE